MAPSFLQRVKLAHLAPPALLLSCLLAMYTLSTLLAAELKSSAAHAGEGAVDTTAPLELSLPSSFEEARTLSLSLSTHLRSHPQSRTLVLLLFAATYVLKQTFSVPGSALLNVMAGFIFGVAAGVPLVAFLTALGASGCYLLSWLVGLDLVGCFPSLAARVAHMQTLIEAEKRKGNLLNYLLVLRVFPLTPNFFVNLASPLVGISYPMFFVTALVGLVPYVYVTVSAGDTLRALTLLQAEGKLTGGGSSGAMSVGDIMDSATMMKLALLALFLLIPTVIKRRAAKDKIDLDPPNLAAKNQPAMQFKL